MGLLVGGAGTELRGTSKMGVGEACYEVMQTLGGSVDVRRPVVMPQRLPIRNSNNW